jgi:hypothetical protein
MKKDTCLVVTTIVLLSALTLGQDSNGSPDRIAQDAGLTLESVQAELKVKTTIAVKVPTYLPGTRGQRIFAVIIGADPSDYNILLATKLPCGGGNACSYGSVRASKSAFDLEGTATLVTLRNSISAQFFPSRCHAFCSQAYITWKEADVFYCIGVKGG